MFLYGSCARGDIRGGCALFPCDVAQDKRQPSRILLKWSLRFSPIMASKQRVGASDDTLKVGASPLLQPLQQPHSTKKEWQSNLSLMQCRRKVCAQTLLPLPKKRDTCANSSVRPKNCGDVFSTSVYHSAAWQARSAARNCASPGDRTDLRRGWLRAKICRAKPRVYEFGIRDTSERATLGGRTTVVKKCRADRATSLSLKANSFVRVLVKILSDLSKSSV